MQELIFNSKGFQWKSFFHLIKKMDSFDFLNESLIALALS